VGDPLIDALHNGGQIADLTELIPRHHRSHDRKKILTTGVKGSKSFGYKCNKVPKFDFALVFLTKRAVRIF